MLGLQKQNYSEDKCRSKKSASQKQTGRHQHIGGWIDTEIDAVLQTRSSVL